MLQSCLAFEVVHRYQYSCCRFRTGKGLGYSAHFVGNKLVLETVGRGHKKPQTHPVDFVFQSYQVSYIYLETESGMCVLCKCSWYLMGRVLDTDL